MRFMPCTYDVKHHSIMSHNVIPLSVSHPILFITQIVFHPININWPLVLFICLTAHSLLLSSSNSSYVGRRLLS